VQRNRRMLGESPLFLLKLKPVCCFNFGVFAGDPHEKFQAPMTSAQVSPPPPPPSLKGVNIVDDGGGGGDDDDDDDRHHHHHHENNNTNNNNSGNWMGWPGAAETHDCARWPHVLP